MKKIKICRNPNYYTTGYRGEDPSKAPFYLRSLLFDGEKGELTQELIQGFNEYLKEKDIFQGYELIQGSIEKIPNKVIIINASSDDLPTSYETKRVFKTIVKSRNWDMEIVVVNKRKELLQEIKQGNDLVISQCVNKRVYNKRLVHKLNDRGVVVVSGKLTAPGSIFSDKGKTYNLLSENRKSWEMVAQYKRIDVRNKTTSQVTNHILNTVDSFQSKLGKDKFFIKPIEGGGGLGGFRIIKSGDKYVIPDLSKVSGETNKIRPSYINIDLGNEKRLRELFWVYSLFDQNKKLNSNYIKVKIRGRNKKEKFENFKKYLHQCKCKQKEKYRRIAQTRKGAQDRLTRAIKKFEEKFNKRYIPLVNEHIDFGAWGLRAHYRFTTAGPLLETIYARIFQLAFTPQGVGYVGADNISNKQTGELEIERLGPINEIMLEAIGGRKNLYHVLYKGAKPVIKLVDLQDKKNKSRVPFRLQLDLAAIAGLIGEVNADTARGLCLASPWNKFVRNTREWFIDAIKYYSWRCDNANL